MTDELDPKLQEFEAKLRKIMLPGYLVEQLQIKGTHSHRYTNQKFSKEITKMNANITRRAALTTVFAILAGGSFAIRYFRKQGNTGIVDYEERKVDSLFTSIIRPEMSPVSPGWQKLDSGISYEPASIF